jgi:hypothetical protein
MVSPDAKAEVKGKSNIVRPLIQSPLDAKKVPGATPIEWKFSSPPEETTGALKLLCRYGGQVHLRMT